MNITENGLYKTSELEENTSVGDGLVVFIFDDSETVKNIVL
jgi:hypothetical protein